MTEEIGNTFLFNSENVIELKQFNNSVNALLEWSGKDSFIILFDSDLDGDGKKILSKKVINKKNLYFISFDNENNIFGGYMNEIIYDTDCSIGDPNAFIFSLIRNGTVINKKYSIMKSEERRVLNVRSYSNILYQFGFGCYYLQSDIIATSINYESRYYCLPTSYKYNEEQQPLRDCSNLYSMTRILVLEMD
ncbi:TLDc domain-containing protein [Entamoeba marina]